MRLKKSLTYPDNLFDALNQLNKERGSDKPFDCTADELLGGMASPVIKTGDMDIIKYRYVNGMSFKEIGEALGVSGAVARNRHYRTMLRLRRSIIHVQNKRTKEVNVFAFVKIGVSEREYKELKESCEKEGSETPDWLYERADRGQITLFRNFRLCEEGKEDE